MTIEYNFVNHVFSTDVFYCRGINAPYNKNNEEKLGPI